MRIAPLFLDIRQSLLYCSLCQQEPGQAQGRGPATLQFWPFGDPQTLFSCTSQLGLPGHARRFPGWETACRHCPRPQNGLRARPGRRAGKPSHIAIWGPFGDSPKNAALMHSPIGPPRLLPGVPWVGNSRATLPQAPRVAWQLGLGPEPGPNHIAIWGAVRGPRNTVLTHSPIGPPGPVPGVPWVECSLETLRQAASKAFEPGLGPAPGPNHIAHRAVWGPPNAVPMHFATGPARPVPGENSLKSLP